MAEHSSCGSGSGDKGRLEIRWNGNGNDSDCQFMWVALTARNLQAVSNSVTSLDTLANYLFQFLENDLPGPGVDIPIPALSVLAVLLSTAKAISAC